MARLVVWGAGELGGRVARARAAAGDAVLAATRGTSRHAGLAAHGVECVLGDVAGRLRPDDDLFLALPGTALQHEAVRALTAAHVSVRRAVLVSSTAFHAGASGRIDESSPRGTGERAAAVAACEAAFAAWAGACGVILRCGGLWAAGRGPAAALRRSREVPPGPLERVLPLVHYDDAAAAAGAALGVAAPERTYLCATPPSPSRGAFYAVACAALGLAPPGPEPYAAASAEYDVTRLRRDLLPTPAHPDWRDAARA